MKEKQMFKGPNEYQVNDMVKVLCWLITRGYWH